MSTQALPKTGEAATSKSGGSRLLKPVVFIACLIPAVWEFYAVFIAQKYVDPIDALEKSTGEWGLRLLILTLCITPLQMIFKWGAVAKLRRMLGLFVFFYATLHLLVWVVLDQRVDIKAAAYAIVDKPFITVGIIVWLYLLALAVTSNKFSVRKLGIKWKKLHNWIYFFTVLSVVHYIWQVRADDILEPAIYMGIIAVLLGWRFTRIMSR